MKITIRRVVAAALLAAVAVSLPLSAAAQVRMTESFVAPVNGVPEGWQAVLRRKENRETVIRIEHQQGEGSLPALLIEREGMPAESGTLYYTGTGGSAAGAGALRPDGLGDFVASVTFRFNDRASGADYRGIVLRARQLTYGEFGGYFVGLAPRGSVRSLGIYYNPKSHVDNGTVLAKTDLETPLRPGIDYVLTVRAQGSVIEAKITAAGSGPDGEELVSVRTDAATESAAGYFGLRGAYSNSGPIRTWFRQLHLTEISK